MRKYHQIDVNIYQCECAEFVLAYIKLFLYMHVKTDLARMCVSEGLHEPLLLACAVNVELI